MNLFQLRYFVTVAQLENISKAAALLHLSQSSLSKSIAKMETELNMPLFERNGKKITLNLQGERFLEWSTGVLQELEQTMNDMSFIVCGGDSKIRIGMAGTDTRLVNCIAAFQSRYPGAEFQVECQVEAEERVDINQYDVLIYPPGSKFEKYSGYALEPERYLLAVHRNHPLARKAVIKPQELSSLDFVFLRIGKNFVEYPYRLCVALAVSMASRNFTDSQQTHRQMIGAGIAAGFVSDYAAEAYASDPRIRLIRIQDSRFSRPMMICFRREKHLSPLALAFKTFSMEYFQLGEAMKGTQGGQAPQGT